jgi:SAM-dependent methyltransferase
MDLRQRKVKHYVIRFIHPHNQRYLSTTEEGLEDVITGDVFPVINGIPRFCSLDNYSASFGFQWRQFDQTQLDLHSGSDQSEQRFYAETAWDPVDLSCCSVLEVGSGAGRFSEVFLRTTAGLLHSVDYSSAVDVNKSNNVAYGDRLRLAQASIYELPFPNESFDKVFCLGVLQHTPSFADSVAALVKKTRAGGEIVVDFYPIKGWYTKIHSKYVLRPFTKRLPKQLLLKLIRMNIGWMLVLFDVLSVVRLGMLTRLIPITDVRSFPRTLTPEQRREWAVMDTFDGFSPEYDNPQRVESVVNMFRINGCEVTYAGMVYFQGGSSMVVRAIKKNGS